MLSQPLGHYLKQTSKQSITERGPLPPPTVHLKIAERAPKCLFLLHQTQSLGDWSGVLSSLKLLPRYATDFLTCFHLQQCNTNRMFWFEHFCFPFILCIPCSTIYVLNVFIFAKKLGDAGP